MLHSNTEADGNKLVRVGLSRLNDWRSPACVTREKTTSLYFSLEDPVMTFCLKTIRSFFYY